MSELAVSLMWVDVACGGASLILVALAASYRQACTRGVICLAVMGMLAWSTLAAQGRLLEWAAGTVLLGAWTLGVGFLVRRFL